MMKEFYKADLAFIHDVGHSEFALKSAPGIIDILRRNGIHEGLIVDLGCGSGLWAGQLVKAHYQVLGIDISPAMISLARKRVPQAGFRIESLFKADIPPCRAVTSISECLNYLFDSDNDNHRLNRLFRRIYNALAPGGIFVFDIGEPGQIKQGVTAKGFTEGDDWTVLVEKKEEQRILTRRIVSFRRAGNHYRRDTELHRQRLYESAEITKELRRTGFRARTIRSYGLYPLPKAHAAFIARKPA
jgi:SAM-dependent methyltransferase